MLPMEVERRLRFVAVFLGSSLHGKPKAHVHSLTWRVGPEPQWEGENKSPGQQRGCFSAGAHARERATKVGLNARRSRG
jgi:hypothetical protein